MTEDHLASCCHHCRSLHQQGLNSNQAFHADTQLSLGATGPPRCLCALKLKNIVSKTVCVFLPLYFRHYRNDLSRHEPAAASPRDPSHVLHSSSLKISTQRLFNHQRGGDYYWILFLFSSWELSHLGGGVLLFVPNNWNSIDTWQQDSYLLLHIYTKQEVKPHFPQWHQQWLTAKVRLWI